MAWRAACYVVAAVAAVAAAVAPAAVAAHTVQPSPPRAAHLDTSSAQPPPSAATPLSVRLRGSRPNVLVIFVDDTGYGDYSFNDASVEDTPNLQALRDKGMRLSDFHAGASVCTPSRAALLSGRLGARTGVKSNFSPYSVAGMPMNETTIAEVLCGGGGGGGGVGYRCGMTGKWHLGHHPPHGPIHRGFDTFVGLPMSHDYGCTNDVGYDHGCVNRTQDVCFPPDLSKADGPGCHIGPNNPWNESIPLFHNDTIVQQPVDLDTLSQTYAAYAAQFIADAAAAQQPFFTYMAFNHMHVPVGNHAPKWTNTSKNGVYGDTLRQLDDSIGVVMQALVDAGVENNTLIFMTGDNGAPDDQCNYGGSNHPFTGSWLRNTQGGGGTGKTTTWEGGHREPGLAVWRGKIAAGSTSAATASTLDYMPTIAALAGAPLPRNRIFDGVDLGPALFDGAASVRPTLFHPNSGCEGKIGDIETVRHLNFKAKYRTGGSCTSCDGKRAKDTVHNPPLIFDLDADEAEANPLAPSDPRYGGALSAIEAALSQLLQSIARDNTTVADYSMDPSVRPCCNSAHPFCVCDAPLALREGDAESAVQSYGVGVDASQPYVVL